MINVMEIKLSLSVKHGVEVKVSENDSVSVGKRGSDNSDCELDTWKENTFIISLR